MSFQVCNPDIYDGSFCGRGDLVTCGDVEENPGPNSGRFAKNIFITYYNVDRGI